MKNFHVALMISQVDAEFSAVSIVYCSLYYLGMSNINILMVSVDFVVSTPHYIGNTNDAYG